MTATKRKLNKFRSSLSVVQAEKMRQIRHQTDFEVPQAD